MLKRVLVAVVYLIGVLAFFEGSARLVLRSQAFRQRVSGDDDATWRYRWLDRHRGGRQVYYSFDVHDPKRGWALKPGLRDAEPWDGVVLNSNSRGVRGRVEHAYAKSPGRTRILVFGDSFTFGEEVSDDETWSAYLEQLIPGAEVLNFGVHGYGQDQMLVYLKEEGVKYEADVVLLGFLYDDMPRNLLSFRDYAKPRFVLRGDRLVLTHSPVPSPDETLAREPYRSRFGDLLTMLAARHRARTGARRERMRQLTVKILDEFHRTVQGMGARTGLAYLPVYGEIDKPDMAMTRREMFFFRYCRRQGIQSMYLRRFFLKKLKAGVQFKTHGHWGPLEHRTAAEGIAAYLLEKGLISPIVGPQPAVAALADNGERRHRGTEVTEKRPPTDPSF